MILAVAPAQHWFVALAVYIDLVNLAVFNAPHQASDFLWRKVRKACYGGSGDEEA